MSFEIRRGDIFYVMKSGARVGSEQWGGRPGVIVSCDENNVYSNVVEVAYCTTKPKSNLPTHVSIMSAYRPSTVLCEQINAVSTERLGDYIGCCTADEMREIDVAIATSLGLKKYPALIKRLRERGKTGESGAENEAVDDERKEEIVRLQTERDTYRKMYEDLMNLIFKGKGVDRVG